MIKFSRGKVIAFDLDEALSFEGESGPYIQYAVVRANNIFQKLQQRDGLDEAALVQALGDVPAGELDGAQRHPRAVGAGARSRPARRRRRAGRPHAGVLGARQMRLHTGPGVQRLLSRALTILNEERDDVRRWRAAAVIYVRTQLTRALDLMGVECQPRM